MIRERENSAEMLKNGTSGEVIVVEDDATLLLLIERKLKSAGFQTKGFLNGTEAIEWIAKNRVMLIVLDYKLQDLNGEKIIKTLRKRRISAPFIVITGKGDENIAVRMMKLGARDYLIKDKSFLDRLPQSMRVTLECLEMERKLEEAKESLRKEEEKFRMLVEKSPVGISLVEGDGRYRYLNEKFIDLFGYTLEDIPTGRDWFHKAFPDRAYRKEVISQWSKFDAGQKVEESCIKYFRVTCKDGGEKVVFFRPVKLENDEYILIYTDYTERRRMEKRLRQAHKMEAVGTLAGGIAHDFNNILMGIQGRVSIMQLEPGIPQSHAEHLNGIEEYVVSAANLCRQLLGFARGGRYDPKPTDLNQIVEKTSSMFARTNKEIRIHYKLAEGVLKAEIDRVQIEQVFLNLYVNAGQAMPRGGDLFLQTEKVNFEESACMSPYANSGTYIGVSVSDTGVGMDDKTRKRVFEPFFTTKDGDGCTGLGLASVYGIMKKHGGHVEVRSKEGEGSTFELYFPECEKDPDDMRNCNTEGVVTGTETILLVDDEEMITDIGEGMLKYLGYDVLTANSGKEAFEIYEMNQNKVDLVILDIIMPDMKGDEVYERLKGFKSRPKTLISSGYTIDGLAAKMLEKGCDGFIQKPFNMEKLSQKVREILDSD